MFSEKFSSLIGGLKLYIKTLFYHKRIISNGFQRIKSDTKILVDSQSKIILKPNIKIRHNSYISSEHGGTITIGEDVFLNNNIYIVSMNSIEIGDNTFIGPNTVIVDHDHDFRNNKEDFITKPITIGKNVWIGANVVILKGTNIGDNSIVAAGTTITDNVPANSIVRNINSQVIKAI